MTSLPSRESFAQAHGGPVPRLQHSTNTSVAGSRFEQPNQQTNWDLEKEWQERLRSLQQWICELLLKNQQLRMSLALATAAEEREPVTATYAVVECSHTSVDWSNAKHPLRSDHSAELLLVNDIKHQAKETHR
jgi:hypothetical protein